MLDFDRDGRDDIVIGWREGQMWEVFGDDQRYLAAAYTRAAKFAEIFSPWFPPSIALFDYEPELVWLIGR